MAQQKKKKPGKPVSRTAAKQADQAWEKRQARRGILGKLFVFIVVGALIIGTLAGVLSVLR